MAVTESSVERAQKLGDNRIPRQRLPYPREALPVQKGSARRWLSAAQRLTLGTAGTAVVVTGTWLVIVPLLNSSSGTHATLVADCVPHHDLLEVEVGMTRQAVFDAFSSAGHIDRYTPRQDLEVVYRGCARTGPWTRLFWIAYVWEHGEWRVAELQKAWGS